MVKTLSGQMQKVHASFNRTANTYHKEDFKRFKDDVNELNRIIQSVEQDNQIYDAANREKVSNLFQAAYIPE